MLHQFTWHQYFITVVVLTIIYYLLILLRYYLPELQKLISPWHGCSSESPLPDVLRYEQTEKATPDQRAEDNKRASPYPESPSEANHLSVQLNACISIAAEKPYAPDALIRQIKKILHEHSELAVSPERPKINQLVVRECEKTGTALLTEEEVDQWWEV